MRESGTLPIDHPDSRPIPQKVCGIDVVVTEHASFVARESFIPRDNERAQLRRRGRKPSSPRPLVPERLASGGFSVCPSFCYPRGRYTATELSTEALERAGPSLRR
jgi:hypothetical protein